MEESGVISDYVDRLARELDFDRSMSIRVRQEVADHLWEAVAADAAGNLPEVQRRAVANFGDPHVIAAQFAVVSVARHSRRTGVAAILAIAGVFIAMKARVGWYAALEWVVGDDVRALSGVVALIDRYTFWLAVVIGLAGWAYIRSCRVPAAFHPTYLKQLRRFFLLCAAATAALFVAVMSDGVLTALWLSGTELSARSVVPILSMTIEIACAVVLVLHIRNLTRRTASTVTLLRT